MALVHGGAGGNELLPERNVELVRIMDGVWPQIESGMDAVSAAVALVKQLEAHPSFNAGFGSTIQADGVARLSASVMDGEAQRFSGVHLVTQVIHPSELALALQHKKNRVVGPLGAQLVAREIGMVPVSPTSAHQAEHWAKQVLKHESESFGGALGSGTVGAVVLDTQGRLAAVTSTGGVSFAVPERVSDVGTPAGNYASKFAAISCTGVGEHIMDLGVSVRLETRVRDGASIIEASEKTLAEARNMNGECAWIAIDHHGNWAVGNTASYMSALARSSTSNGNVVI